MRSQLALLCLSLLVASVSVQGITIPGLNITIPLPPNNGTNSTGSGSGASNFTLTIPDSTECYLTADVRILNYLLQLEFMQVEYWKQALAAFHGRNVSLAGVSSTCLNQTNVLTRLLGIQNQDQSHASSLNTSINNMCSSLPDGDVKNECYPVSPCTFNFSFPANPASTSDFNDILGKGIQLEDFVVQAYLGSIPQLTETANQRLLMSIVTVDARHSAYARQIGGQVPFPNNVDSSATRSTIKCSLRQYISSDCCPGWQRLSC